MTAYYNHYDTAVKNIIAHVGKEIILGIPLALGKPIGFINALYRLAKADASIHLTIITGLTLARPRLGNELEKKFIEPILERTLKDYEDPLYEIDRVLQQLPDNIKVIEFFLSPGKFLQNNYVQENYVSSKYTSAARDSLFYKINVHAQLVAHSDSDSNNYSLSCNSDLFYEVAESLKVAQQTGRKIAIVAEVNQNLPFMYGDAIVESTIFTDIIDTKRYKTLFPIPRMALSIEDHLIGIYTSTLIKDGGCLQIGIGKLGDAVASALILRHKHNKLYRELLKELFAQEKFNAVINCTSDLSTFEQGLYLSTEMISDAALHLYKEGLVKKRVYDHEKLQQLINLGKIKETITPAILDILLDKKIITEQLSLSDFIFLKKFGIFKPEINYINGDLVFPSGKKTPADLAQPHSKAIIIKEGLGKYLYSGKLIHAAFFIGSSDFYQTLRDLPLDELKQISMTSVARTNSLLLNPNLLRLQRQNARFVNTAMMVTLGGAIVSDGLKDLAEVSGVGGQFDFVDMAHVLEGARSIINCHSTRKSKKDILSNILWEYPNITIPRYLRDIVVTEYGIADCRSKIDTDVIKTILNITDSRFQNTLLKKAKQHGKVEQAYQISESFQHNYPQFIKPIIQEMQVKGFCKPYPFGCDLTEEELVLKQILFFLKDCSRFHLFKLILLSLIVKRNPNKATKYLLRMGLLQPKTLKQYIYKNLLIFLINKEHS